MDSPPEIGWKDLNLPKFYLMMPAGSMIMRMIVYPIQLVKTRIQASKDANYRGAFSAARSIVQQHGFRSLYQGFWTNTFGIVAGPVYITGFEYSRHTWAQLNEKHGWVKNAFVADKMIGGFIGGAFASLASQTLSVPIDIITQHQMVQQVHEKKGPVQITREIIANQGLKGMFRGYFVSLLIYVPSSGITWSTFYTARAHMRSALLSTQDLTILPQWQSVAIVPLAGIVAGATSATVTNPLDVIRTRMQLETSGRPSIKHTLGELIKQDGYRGLSRGLNARILSSSTTMMVIMSMYETLKWLAT